MSQVQLNPQPAHARGSRRQTVASVARAEASKFLAPGGVRGWLTASVVLGACAGIGTALLSMLPEVQEILALSVAGSLSAGPLVVIIAMSMATANHVSRELTDGTIVTSKYLVPRTRILFLGRMVGWSAIGGLTAVSTAVLTLPVALLIPAVHRSGPLTAAAALVLVGVVPALAVALVHAGTLVLRRGAYVVGVGLTLLVLVPLLAALGQVLVTGMLATAARTLSSAMVGPLLLAAMAVPEDGVGAWTTTLLSLTGVLLWLGVVTALAFRAFTRPGYGEV